MTKLKVRKPKKDNRGIDGIEDSRQELIDMKSNKYWEHANQKSCESMILAEWPLEKAGLYVMRANNLIQGAMKRYRKANGVEDS